MKKFMIVLISLVVVGIGYFIYDSNFGGESYYTQITTNGKKFTSKSDQGDSFIDYSYTLKAYNVDGNEKTLQFNGNKDVPLRKTAFLKLKVNRNKGVLSWEEVKKSELPKAAKAKLLN